MESIIVEKAGKIIKGNVIFEDVSFTCERGNIYGLIGRNGAGKTMLLKCICGLSNYTSGKIIVNNKVIGKDVEIPDLIGVIIEVAGFLPHKSAFSNLKYLAALTGKVDDNRIRNVIKTVGLNPEEKKPVGKYSLGMRQRLGIAQAIMEDPEIMLLDEPMNGLDNEGVADIKKMLLELKEQGKTIILSSHHMEDINELCDEKFFMDKGYLKRK